MRSRQYDPRSSGLVKAFYEGRSSSWGETREEDEDRLSLRASVDTIVNVVGATGLVHLSAQSYWIRIATQHTSLTLRLRLSRALHVRAYIYFSLYIFMLSSLLLRSDTVTRSVGFHLPACVPWGTMYWYHIWYRLTVGFLSH